MHDVNQDEQVQRECEEALQAEIELRVDERAARAKHCLAALRVAGIELDGLTLVVLRDLADHLRCIIDEVASADPTDV